MTPERESMRFRPFDAMPQSNEAAQVMQSIRIVSEVGEAIDFPNGNRQENFTFPPPTIIQP